MYLWETFDKFKKVQFEGTTIYIKQKNYAQITYVLDVW